MDDGDLQTTFEVETEGLLAELRRKVKKLCQRLFFFKIKINMRLKTKDFWGTGLSDNRAGKLKVAKMYTWFP